MSDDILHLTEDLYTFVLNSEHITSKNRTAFNGPKFRAWADDLRDRFAQVKSDTGTRVHDQIQHIRENLSSIGEELVKQHPSPKLLKNRWVLLGRNYESLVILLQKSSQAAPKTIPRLKPKNYTRNVFHLFNSLWAVLLYELVFEKQTMLYIAGSFLVLAIGMEVLRRLSPDWNHRFCNEVFGSISRPHEEHNITAATWYTLALFIGVITMPKHAIAAGTLMLGVGDPIASIVGKAWGKRKLWNGKSLEGTIGFALSSSVALMILFSLACPQLSLQSRLIITAVVALCGALTELFTGKLEDNFTIPLVGGSVATLCLSLV